MTTSVTTQADSAGDERDWIIAGSWAGTAAFAVSSLVGVLASSFVVVSTAVSLVLFGLGCGAFLFAFARGVSRSREEQVSVFGLYFLIGSAPGRQKWLLHLATIVQLAIAIAAAAARPFTAAAFGILVPMFGLGMSGLWGALRGTFTPRRSERSDG